MKIIIAVFVLFSFVLANRSYSQESAKKPSAQVSVTGEVIDSRCYISSGAKGEDHKQCAIDCANGGIPLAIVEDATGTVYFVGNANDQMKGANELLIDYVAEKVTVKGKVVERGGAKMIVAKSVEKAK